MSIIMFISFHKEQWVYETHREAKQRSGKGSKDACFQANKKVQCKGKKPLELPNVLQRINERIFVIFWLRHKKSRKIKSTEDLQIYFWSNLIGQQYLKQAITTKKMAFLTKMTVPT